MSGILHVCILLIYSLHHGSTHTVKHTVTCQQHGEAVITFHFAFISGPEDLHVTIMKMESIDTNPTVIYKVNNGAVEYHAAQYRDRTEIRTDLSIGKLDLILKHVKKSDEGIYICQAANPKDQDEKMIHLHVEIKQRSTDTVTCQEHGEAKLSFHFPFVSGPEDLHISIMKMESIGDTEPAVIYSINKGAVEYYAAPYRHRTEIRTDLFRGKLDLILKHVKESDEGLYTCQAANKKNLDEKTIHLHVEIKQNGRDETVLGSVPSPSYQITEKSPVQLQGSTQNVTCQQHKRAELPFHFSFISGPEDLHVTIMKMESIDGDTEPAVIYALKQGVSVYQSDQYRDHTEIHNDLSSGKLDLILKHVKISDAGIYKCQAANKKKHDEKMIQLYIQQTTTSDTENPVIWPIVIGGISGFMCVCVTICITLFLIKRRKNHSKSCRRKSQEYSEKAQSCSVKEIY